MTDLYSKVENSTESSLSPFIQFILLLVLVGVSGVIVSIIASLLMVMAGINPMVLEDLGSSFSENILTFKWLQIFSSVGFFIVPTLIFGYWVYKKPFSYLKMTRPLEITPTFYTPLIMLSAFGMSILLLYFNQQMQLPEILSGIEQWMLEQEEKTMEMTLMFLEANNFLGLLLNLLMIAVLPALGEEMLFRGGLQQVLVKWFKNPHVAILVTGAAFSFIHFQFYGFLPRMFIGIYLGYLFYWSKNLWYPILAHFLNNGFQVVGAYYNVMEDTPAGSDMQVELTSQLLSASLVSTVIFLGLMWMFRKYFYSNKLESLYLNEANKDI